MTDDITIKDMMREIEDLKALLNKSEILLDYLNSQHATREEYCLYCDSTTYNGKEGIVHADKCIITQIRRRIDYNG